MWSKLSSRRNNQLAQITINIAFIVFGYMLIISAGNTYQFKKILTLYFLLSLITLLITSNTIIRTKFYLATGSLALSLIQIRDYSFFANILDKDFCLAFAVASITCSGLFRLTRSRECEGFLNFISLTSPFLLFYIFEKIISDYEILLYYFITAICSSIYISIMRQEKISSASLAEIFSAYLIILHSKNLIPQDRSFEYLMFFMFMTFSYTYLKTSNLSEKYKKTMDYVMALLPLLVNIGLWEYITVFVILFNLILSPYFYNLKDIERLDISFLEELLGKIENINLFDNFKFEIREFPRISLSTTFCIFFMLFLLFYLSIKII